MSEPGSKASDGRIYISVKSSGSPKDIACRVEHCRDAEMQKILALKTRPVRGE